MLIFFYLINIFFPFQIENASSLAVDYRILLDSQSFHKHASQQELPAFLRREDPLTLTPVGTANVLGTTVFDCVPAEGRLEPGMLLVGETRKKKKMITDRTLSGVCSCHG